MRHSFLILLMMFVASLGTQSAFGFVEFHKEWVKLHIDATDKSPEAKAYEKLVAKGKDRCFTCHQGKKKTNHNPYGMHFVGVLTKEDKKDTDKIIATLKEVAEKKVDPSDENSKTYADLIKEKKFPGGELEELQKEPEGEDK